MGFLFQEGMTTNSRRPQTRAASKYEMPGSNVKDRPDWPYILNPRSKKLTLGNTRSAQKVPSLMIIDWNSPDLLI
jgi:hypothetical protein